MKFNETDYDLLTKSDLTKEPMVYVIVSTTNGAFYVGSTGDIKDRIKSHRHKLNKNSHRNSKLQKLKNEGSKFNILFKKEPTRDGAFMEEQRIIDTYSCSPLLCNINRNAFSACHGHTTESKKRLSEHNTGKKMAPESIEKTRQGLLNHKHRNELNQNASIARKSGGNPNAKPVLCYGILYNTGSDAARTLGISRSVMARKLGTGKGSDPHCIKMRE